MSKLPSSRDLASGSFGKRHLNSNHDDYEHHQLDAQTKYQIGALIWRLCHADSSDTHDKNDAYDAVAHYIGVDKKLLYMCGMYIVNN
jgi:hypothetical protein